MASLPAAVQRQLKRHIQVFVAEKPFIGCAGVEITDEHRVTIAAQACLLLLGHPKPDDFPRLREVLVYPGFADVDIVAGPGGPEVQTGGGTSLHDVSGWYLGKEFWIPVGTDYADEIFIRKDKHPKVSTATNVQGTHYQLEPRTQMTLLSFKGHLDNMARAAVVRQCALAKI